MERNQKSGPDEASAINDPLLELSGIMQLLRGCVIAPNYTVQDYLVAPIKLTPVGDRIREELREKHRRTRPNEAHLAVALCVGVGDELLVDAEQTDISTLRTALTQEIAKNRILFPDPYSRQISEELFLTHEYRARVSNRDTLKLLRNHEQGVYQVGYSTVGPWGCIESPQARALEPKHRIYGYYCENSWCTSVHPFILETAENAPINKAQTDLSPILESHRPATPDRQLQAFRLKNAQELSADPFVDSTLLLNFIGDALNEKERIELAIIALRRVLKTDTRARTHFSAVSSRILQDPSEFVHRLSFCEVMQLLHLFTDDNLIRSIDEAVYTGLIETSADLRRTVRIERWPREPLSAEIGTKGLRFHTPQDRESIILGRVLNRIYADNPDELVFALDRPPTENLDELISYAFQNMEVEAVADSCLINNLNSITQACQLLHLDDKGLSRAERSDRLKWRLGISNEVVTSNTEFLITAIDDYLTAPPERSEDEKRGDLSNIYVRIETELMLAIRFASWALTSDHYTQAPRFSLRISELPDAAMYIRGVDGGELKGRPTFHPLASSFARLADALEEMPVRARDIDSTPVAVRVSGRPFAFRHLSMVHDLASESRARLVTALRGITAELSDKDVLAVRNTGPGHGNNPFPDDNQIRVALTRVKRGLQALAEAGLTPIVYERSAMNTGQRGQMETLYHSWVGDAIVRVPYWPLAPGLPNSATHLIVVPSAYGPGWGSLRFAVPAGDRGGARWNAWPPRRRSTQTADWDASCNAKESDVEDGSVMA